MTKWVQRLIIANVIMFFLQLTVGGFTRALELVPGYVLVRPWTLFTYMFLHDPGDFMHIAFNMLGLYWFGSQVEQRLGAQRFLTLYFISGLTGAILSIFLTPNAAVIGASGAIFGIMLAFARFWPDATIMMGFFFPMQARFAVLLMAAIQLWSGFRGGGGVANFCHLGGFAGAYLYLVYLERRAGVKKFRSQTVAPVAKENLSNWKRIDTKKIHEVNRDEVNRILDKISAQGMGGLTAQEKLFLSNFVPPDDRVPPIS